VIKYRDKKYNLRPPFEQNGFDKSKITAARLSKLFGD